MQRILALFKCLPAVLCGLLLAAWPVSLFVDFGVSIPLPDGTVTANCFCGRVSLRYAGDASSGPELTFRFAEGFRLRFSKWLGGIKCQLQGPLRYLQLPIPGLLTLLLPFAAGPFVGFRFPLWFWFAWSAMLALELAFYLR